VSILVRDSVQFEGKPLSRRTSTPESIEENINVNHDDKFGKLSTIKRDEQHLSPAHNPKRSTTTELKAKTTSDNKYGSNPSVFKLTETSTTTSSNNPIVLKAPAKRELDDKWLDMFGSNKHDDNAAKEDLLSKLIADEQQERRTTAANRSSMATYEPSTRTTIGRHRSIDVHR
jgi:hypothetical protein